ncbi:ATP dependent DNA ligase [Nocardia tengchongensis]|uniref:ATP dependent DNA ligase n=1 Tax=Nocardia tengchongensis TaxID=2055889 RepID=UPI0036C94DF5
MLEAAAANDIEGVVGKRIDSVYRGGRSQAWRKLPLRRTTECVVVGWLDSPTGSKAFGSLLLAAHDQDQQLILLGVVGSGFSDRARLSLHHELLALATPNPPVTGAVPPSIAATAHWVTPRLVGDIAYRERTANGLRHPSWRGLRFDRSAAEVSLPEHS